MQLNQTVLHKACANGDVGLVRTLIEFGASVDLKGKVRLFRVHDRCIVVYSTCKVWLLDMIDTSCTTYYCKNILLYLLDLFVA